MGNTPHDPSEIGALLRSRVDALAIIDPTGKVMATNLEFESIFGFTQDEIIGKNVKMLMPSPYFEEHDEYLRKYKESGEKNIIGIGRQVLAKRKNGEVFPADLSVSELNFSGSVYFAGVIRDLSGKIEAEEVLVEQRARLESIVNTVVDGIITINDQGIIKSVNQAAVDLFGYSKKELIGQNIKVLMPSPYQEEHDTYLEAYKSTKVKKIIGIGREVQGLKKDGTVFPMELSVSEVRFKNKQIFTGLVRDITESKDLTNQLIEKESLAKLGEMCAIVAHEIKNPIAGVIGALRMLERRVKEDEFQSELCEEMVSRMKILGDRVNDILRFARPRAPVIKNVPARALIEDTIQLIEKDPLFSDVRVEVQWPTEEIEVACDSNLIKDIFLNLLVNSAQALKDQQGEIIIHWEESQGCGLFFIDDSGPGIDEEVLDQIFQPFFTTKHSGTGLGLSIAQRLIKGQDGDLQIQNRPEGGTRAIVRIPLA